MYYAKSKFWLSGDWFYFSKQDVSGLNPSDNGLLIVNVRQSLKLPSDKHIAYSKWRANLILHVLITCNLH